MAEDGGSSDDDFLGIEGATDYPSAKLRRIRAIFLGTHRRRRASPPQNNQRSTDVANPARSKRMAACTTLTSSDEEDTPEDLYTYAQDVGTCTARLRKLCAKPVVPLGLESLTKSMDSNNAQINLDDLRDSKRVEDAALKAKVLHLQMVAAKQLAALEASFRSNVSDMTQQLSAAIEMERSQSMARLASTASPTCAPTHIKSTIFDCADRTSGTYRPLQGTKASSLAKLEAAVSADLLTRVKATACPPSSAKLEVRRPSQTKRMSKECGTWPEAPQSPHRAMPTTWKNGMSRESSSSQRKSSKDQDCTSHRFLSPSEAAELELLRSTLGRMTELMEDAVV